MRSLLITLCILLTASTIRADHLDTYLELAKPQMVTCAKEFGFADQTPRQILEKELSAGVDKASCLSSCVMKRGGFMKDSKFDTEKMKTFIGIAHMEDPEKLQTMLAVMADCIKKVQSMEDECKMANGYIQCFINKL